MQFQIKNLKYFYPEVGKPAVDVNSFSLEKGKFLLLTGPSGCGKTTFARILGGLIPDFYGGKIQGDVLFNGESLFSKAKRRIRKNIGMVFQNPEKQIVMNGIKREIAFGLENLGIESHEIKRTIERIFSEFGLDTLRDVKTENLSSGQKQKLAIASVVAMNPEIIILDEPTSQLDPEASAQILDIIKKLNKERGVTIILIEHRIRQLLPIVDRTLYMKDSRILIDENPQQYIRRIEKEHEDFPLKISRTKTSKYLPDNDYIMEVKDLHFSYDRKVKLLRGIDFSLRKKEWLSIAGSNGAGKSTLLKVISNVINPDSGQIAFKCNKKPIKVGFLSQNPNDYLFNDSVELELRYTMDNLKIDDDYVVEEILSAMDLTEFSRNYPRDLSTGQRQRVALASIMVADPPVLILDEPTRGLDCSVKMKLGDSLKELIENKGISIILVTQDYEFMLEYSDRIKIMASGKLKDYKNEKTFRKYEDRVGG